MNKVNQPNSIHKT